MAYTFPLSVAEFMALMPIAEIAFDSPPQVEVSQTGGGEGLSHDLGPMLWTGDVTLGRMLRDEAVTPDVLLDILRPAGRSFYAFDTRRPYPLADPTGAGLGASTPTIASLLSGNRELTLQGLPGLYVLSRGDYLAFDYGTPTRRALHKVVSLSVQADVAGLTPAIEVTPLLRPGAAVGAAVTLALPACKAKLVPGSVSKGKSRSTLTEGMSFQFIQTLR